MSKGDPSPPAFYRLSTAMTPGERPVHVWISLERALDCTEPWRSFPRRARGQACSALRSAGVSPVATLNPKFSSVGHRISERRKPRLVGDLRKTLTGIGLASAGRRITAFVDAARRRYVAENVPVAPGRTRASRERAMGMSFSCSPAALRPRRLFQYPWEGVPPRQRIAKL